MAEATRRCFVAIKVDAKRYATVTTKLPCLTLRTDTMILPMRVCLIKDVKSSQYLFILVLIFLFFLAARHVYSFLRYVSFL